MLKRFILWYLLKHNAAFQYKGYFVRAFSEDWYNQNVSHSGMMEKEIEYQEKIQSLIKVIEEICTDVRERSIKDYVCGLCEYDADHGLEGYANECPGFETNNCFKLKEDFKNQYMRKGRLKW